MPERLIVTIVLWLAAVAPAAAWQFAEGGNTTRVVVDGVGGVYALGDLLLTQPINFTGAVVKLDAATGAELWRFLQGPSSYASGIAVRPGIVVVSMAEYGAIRLDAATGVELWRWEPAGSTVAGDLLVNAAGDVIVVGGVEVSGRVRWAVTKLSGATGAVVWQYAADGSSIAQYPSSAARTVAIDDNGDVIAAGRFENLFSVDFGVVKISGATGAQLWRADIGGISTLDYAWDIVADAAGDVIATGAIGYPSVTATVVKLSGNDGSEIWRDTPPLGVEFRGVVALDSSGDVFVGGNHVTKLDSATGVTQWSVPAPNQPYGGSWGLQITPDDDVVTAFFTSGLPGAPSFARLSGTDGTTMWTRSVRSPAFDQTGAGIDAALTPDGSVFGATYEDFLVLGVREELTGHKLSYRDAEPAKLTLVSRDALVFAPAPGEANDPSSFGATLDVMNPDTSEAVSVSLPAIGWTSATSKNGKIQWKYADPTNVCRRVALKSTGKLVVKCVGPLGFSLDEPSQGRMAVALSFAGGHRHCLDFASGILVDQPGKFVATGVPAPATCPIP